MDILRYFDSSLNTELILHVHLVFMRIFCFIMYITGLRQGNLTHGSINTLTGVSIPWMKPLVNFDVGFICSLTVPSDSPPLVS